MIILIEFSGPPPKGLALQQYQCFRLHRNATGLPIESESGVLFWISPGYALISSTP